MTVVSSIGLARSLLYAFCAEPSAALLRIANFQQQSIALISKASYDCQLPGRLSSRAALAQLFHVDKPWHSLADGGRKSEPKRSFHGAPVAFGLLTIQTLLCLSRRLRSPNVLKINDSQGTPKG